MGTPTARGSAIDELSRIDYFLDQLARAVEHGDVPIESYTALAPRYLAQREELVAILTGASPAPPTSGDAALGGRALPRTRPSKPRRERAPVRWTTVLLFLGAFLVIVASGIFAAAVWDITGPLFRLGFLGSLTVAFYAAGYYTRSKLKLRAGGMALTVVASAMLLFDCWIVIDGFNLAGPLPWAVALLLCSAVYWVTEALSGDRFYGVIGAAAQVGWWWLLGAGLGLEAPVRIAGISAVAAVWQLTSERVAKGSSVESLGEVLGWAAPLVQAAAVVALLANLVQVGSPDATFILSAAVVAAGAGVAASRTRHLPRGHSLAAAVTQLPLLLGLAGATDATAWWMVVALVALAATYAVVSLLGAGTAFAILALAAEFSAVGLVGELLPSMTDAWGAVAYAFLAVTWIAAARITGDTVETPAPPETARFAGSEAFSVVSWLGGLALLFLSTLIALTVVDAVPMGSSSIVGEDVALCAAILVAWAGASLVRRRPVLAIGAALWSYYALATAVAWLAPELEAPWQYVALIALAGVWLSARGAMVRFYRIDADAFAWITRGVAALLVVTGVFVGLLETHGAGGWPAAAVAAAGALLFLGDALRNSQIVSAAGAGVFATMAAFFLGGVAVLASSQGNAAALEYGSAPWGYQAMAAAAGALLLGLGAWALKAKYRRQASALALAAACTGSIACEAAYGDAWHGATALALVAGAWVAVAVVTEWHWFVGIGGGFLMGAVACVLSATDAPAWATVLVFVGVAVAFNGLGAIGAFAPAGRMRAAGWALAIAGCATLAFLALAGWAVIPAINLLDAEWLDFGWHGVAVVLAALGGLAILQSRRYRLEPALYAGCAVILLAAFSEFQAFRFTTPELYSTSLAAYTIGMGYLYAAQRPERRVPAVTDILGVLILLWTPVFGALTVAPGPDLFAHTAWAIALSLVAIGAGIVLRVRAYLYAGTAAIAVVALWRTAGYLAQFWWVVLGVIGIAMLVIALSWERQRMLLSDTQRRLRDSFEDWR